MGELPRRRWTLRTRLVVTQVTLLAAVSVVIGLVSVLTLNHFLFNRLDTQLQAVTRLAGSVKAGKPLPGQPPSSPGSPGRGIPSPNDDGSGPPPLPPGTGIGALSASLPTDGRARQGSVSTQENLYGEPLTEDQLEVLAEVPADGRSHAVEIGGSFGGYLVIADDTSSGEVLITGLPLRDVKQITITLGALISGVAILGLLTVGFAGAAMVRLSLRPLHRVVTTARRVAQLPLDRGQVALAVRVPGQDTDDRTEVGQVGQALNRMLEHVASALQARQDSEMRVRRFVSDAGHELRTPLASIRGYAELTRRRRAEMVPDVAHALERIESEAVRMTGLVEELLLLARLDEGRPLDRVPVDLSQLVVTAVSDAHVAGPGHQWLLDLPEDPVRVPGDQHRLHQVVANLLTNARMHTPTGTRVQVTLATGDGVAEVRVADSGPGIPPGLVPEVFDRFTRADTSRSRVAGSTGLGLAIVQAVVRAHGGRVGVTSRPGETVFTVRLPLDPGSEHPPEHPPEQPPEQDQPVTSAKA